MTSAMRSLLLSLIALSATAVALSAKPDDLTPEQQKKNHHANHKKLADKNRRYRQLSSASKFCHASKVSSHIPIHAVITKTQSTSDFNNISTNT